MKDGRITDYSIANVYWEELKAMTTLKWKDYEGRFRPLYLELRNRYPDVPVAPFEFPPEVPQHYQTMYQYLHDTGCNTVRKEAFEKEVLNIIRADLPTLPTEDQSQDSQHAEVYDFFTCLFHLQADCSYSSGLCELLPQLCGNVHSTQEGLCRYV